jgi:hypothetical protein
MEKGAVNRIYRHRQLSLFPTAVGGQFASSRLMDADLSDMVGTMQYEDLATVVPSLHISSTARKGERDFQHARICGTYYS